MPVTGMLVGQFGGTPQPIAAPPHGASAPRAVAAVAPVLREIPLKLPASRFLQGGIVANAARLDRFAEHVQGRIERGEISLGQIEKQSPDATHRLQSWFFEGLGLKPEDTDPAIVELVISEYLKVAAPYHYAMLLHSRLSPLVAAIDEVTAALGRAEEEKGALQAANAEIEGRNANLRDTMGKYVAIERIAYDLQDAFARVKDILPAAVKVFNAVGRAEDAKALEGFVASVQQFTAALSNLKVVSAAGIDAPPPANAEVTAPPSATSGPEASAATTALPSFDWGLQDIVVHEPETCARVEAALLRQGSYRLVIRMVREIAFARNFSVDDTKLIEASIRRGLNRLGDEGLTLLDLANAAVTSLSTVSDIFSAIPAQVDSEASRAGITEQTIRDAIVQKAREAALAFVLSSTDLRGLHIPRVVAGAIGEITGTAPPPSAPPRAAAPETDTGSSHRAPAPATSAGGPQDEKEGTPPPPAPTAPQGGDDAMLARVEAIINAANFSHLPSAYRTHVGDIVLNGIVSGSIQDAEATTRRYLDAWGSSNTPVLIALLTDGIGAIMKRPTHVPEEAFESWLVEVIGRAKGMDWSNRQGIVDGINTELVERAAKFSVKEESPAPTAKVEPAVAISPAPATPGFQFKLAPGAAAARAAMEEDKR